MPPHSLRLYPASYAIAQLDPDARIPEPDTASSFVSITRTTGELSIVCEASAAPPDAKVEDGFRLLGVEGSLSFEEVGVLRDITHLLAEAGVSVFVVSTFETDYILVREAALDEALAALGAGRWRLSTDQRM
jgi:hypothetical protein